MPELYTVGHSNHSLEHFLALLEQYQIEVLCDVRTSPYSRYSPQFNAEALKVEVQRAGLKYVSLGKELGGRPDGIEFYDPEGHVYYARVARAGFFRQGLERLRKGMAQYRVAIFCSEENPHICHRRLLVARVLRDEIDIRHIRGDGTHEREAELMRSENGVLFGESDETTWKSIPSVLPKKVPSSSLNS